jgi:hypothetical protein
VCGTKSKCTCWYSATRTRQAGSAILEAGRLIHVVCILRDYQCGRASDGAKSPMFHESRREQRIMFWKESHLGSVPLILRVIYVLG